MFFFFWCAHKITDFILNIYIFKPRRAFHEKNNFSLFNMTTFLELGNQSVNVGDD